MKEIFDELLRASQDPTAAVIATVVATEGTAPRKEGSKMLVIGGKSLKGVVTIGGCVDSQIIEAAEDVARSGIPQLLRMELGEEDAFEIGLTCAGVLRVLVEPAAMKPEISTKLQSLLNGESPFALLTVTRSSIPSVQPSTKAIVTSGSPFGSLGDDHLDQVAFDVARDLLSKGISRALDLDHAWRPVQGHRQATVEVFIDTVGYRPDLFIFGAGQIAVPIARLAAEAGFRVRVFDTRPLFVNRERFPTAGEVLVGFPGEIARNRHFSQFSFALLLTHAAKHDLPVLETLLRSDVKYIGVLGSSKRALALARRLKEAGFTEPEIARIHIPVGLDIGAETAEQISVAVVGELLMVRSGTTGKSLHLVKSLATPA